MTTRCQGRVSTAVYNYSYDTSRLDDNSGKRIGTMVVGPPSGPNATLNVGVDVVLYVVAPGVTRGQPSQDAGQD